MSRGKLQTKHRVRLIRWSSADAVDTEETAARLQAAGYVVDFNVFDGTVFRELKEDPPQAVIIDLHRAPSQGRDLGLTLRKSKSTRHLPLVFVEADPDKTVHIKELLPDAVFTTRSRICGSVKQSIANPPAEPVVPRSVFDGYSGTPLVRKLGIKKGSVVFLVGAPPDFQTTLGELPEGAVLRRQARGSCDLIIWFTKSRKDLEHRIERMGALAGKDGLWIAWPKKTSEMAGDLSQVVVRRVGLAKGLVDYKVCSIDSDWTGLRFTRRK